MANSFFIALALVASFEAPDSFDPSCVTRRLRSAELDEIFSIVSGRGRGGGERIGAILGPPIQVCRQEREWGVREARLAYWHAYGTAISNRASAEMHARGIDQLAVDGWFDGLSDEERTSPEFSEITIAPLLSRLRAARASFSGEDADRVGLYLAGRNFVERARRGLLYD